MPTPLSRRVFLRSTALALPVWALARPAIAQAVPRVVVVGGGFGGVTAVRELKRQGIDVTLVEPNQI